MRIISFTDVITNSSSEVFVYYTPEGLNSIKQIVNGILDAGESKYRFDDLFEIKLIVDEEGASESFEERYERKPESEQELLEYALKETNGYEGICYIEGFDVTAKDPKNKFVAELIASMNNIFDEEAIWN